VPGTHYLCMHLIATEICDNRVCTYVRDDIISLCWCSVQVSYIYRAVSWLLTPFLHTASNQKLELGKAWERGYH